MTNPCPGLWTFTRMALQMVIELGLHRERSCLEPSRPQEEHQQSQQNLMDPSKKVRLDDYDQSSETLLFWIVYTLDVSLCNGTGRVPGLKRHEINVRLPTDTDLAITRAGPGGPLVRDVQCSSQQAVTKCISTHAIVSIKAEIVIKYPAPRRLLSSVSSYNALVISDMH